jgi:hypothetical protein
MTQAEQHTTWMKFHSFQAKIENKFVPIVLTPIKNSINAFVARGLTKLDDLGIAGKLIPVLNNLYYQCGYGYGYGVYKQFRNVKRMITPEDIAREVVNELRLSLLINVHGIEDTIKAAILQKIQEGNVQGWSYEKTAQAVEGVASIVRSRRIVRTESVKASNMSAINGAKATGLLMDKQWISAKDARVRGNPGGKYPESEFDHWDMNGRIVAMDAPFFLGSRTGGSDQLQFPGDPKGSPADIINCRCVCSFIPRRDERGRAIRYTPGAFQMAI